MIPAVTGAGGSGSSADFFIISGQRALPSSETGGGVWATPFNYDTGFGTNFSDPFTLPSAGKRAGGVGFGPNTGAAAVQFVPSAISGGTTDVTNRVYAFSGSGWGTNYASPATSTLNGAPGTSDVRFFPNPGIVVFTSGTSPYVGAYPWSNSTGFGTKYGNPPTLPTGAVYQSSFRNQTTQAIVLGHATSPFVSAYPWSGGFGTKYANPSTLPASTVTSVVFSPDGANVLVATNASPWINAYAWSSGFSTKYANPATLPSGTSSANVAWRGSSGSDVLISTNTNTYAYPWSGGFGTKYADPSPAIGGTQWNADGNVVLAGVGAVRWSNGFSTAYVSWTPPSPYSSAYSSFNNQP